MEPISNMLNTINIEEETHWRSEMLCMAHKFMAFNAKRTSSFSRNFGQNTHRMWVHCCCWWKVFQNDCCGGVSCIFGNVSIERWRCSSQFYYLEQSNLISVWCFANIEKSGVGVESTTLHDLINVYVQPH